MGPIGCPDTSVRNYHHPLRKIPESQIGYDIVQWQPTSDILTGYSVYHPDPWHAPLAASTVVNTPDDGRRKRPKHVE
jgi:hypothetical protein